MNNISARGSLTYLLLIALFGCSKNDIRVVNNEYAVSSNQKLMNPWIDEDSNPFKINFEVTLNGADVTQRSDLRYMCQTAYFSKINSATEENCDGDAGINPYHIPTKDQSKPAGTYITKLTVKSGNNIVATDELTYYQHESLDNVTTCSDTLTPLDYETKARQYLDTSSTFGANTEISHPIVKLDFGSFTREMRTLRKQFTLSADNRLVTLTRNYQSTILGSCKAIKMKIHECLDDIGNPTYYCDGRGGRSAVECDALVIAANGRAVCMQNQSNVPVFAFFENVLSADWSQEYYDSIADCIINSNYFYSTAYFTKKTLDPDCPAEYPGFNVLYLPE